MFPIVRNLATIKTMDVKKLINAVFTRRPLWDQICKQYHDRGKIRRSWIEVSEELNVPYESARRKWKGLRDTFRRENKKMKLRIRSGALGEENNKSSWPYYENLNFLVHQISSKSSTGNIAPLSSTADTTHTRHDLP